QFDDGEMLVLRGADPHSPPKATATTSPAPSAVNASSSPPLQTVCRHSSPPSPRAKAATVPFASAATTSPDGSRASCDASTSSCRQSSAPSTPASISTALRLEESDDRWVATATFPETVKVSLVAPRPG